jgi:putative ABC transport system permease protein
MSSSDLLHDVRVAFRGLLKAPTLTFVVILTLAVAIGANTAIFSVVQSVLLRPLPYPDEGRIVRVAATAYPSEGDAPDADRGNSFSPAGYLLFVDNNRSFEAFGGYLALPLQVSLTGDGSPLRVNAGQLTLSAFEVLGVSPERGRLPTAQEDTPGGPVVALLSHDLWVNRYGADPSIVGRTIQVNGTSRQVIGIMPASYDFPSPDVDVWIPFQLPATSTTFSAHFISAIARLAPGVTVDAAIADARSLIARYGEVGYAPTWFESVLDGGAVVRPLREYIVGNSGRALLIVLGTVGLVLLIACSNVANLLLVRAERRRQENAVRMALGSSRARLARHMLIESVMLALAGGAAGVLLAYAGTRALVSIGPAGIPRLDEIGIDGSALALTALVSVSAGLLFGVLPAIRSSASRTMVALRDGSRSGTSGRGRHRVRNALVTTQIALAFVVVIGAGLMIRSFEALRSVDPGFSADRVLTFQVSPLPTKYANPEAVGQFYDRLTERLEAVPGVVRAGAIDALPLTGGGLSWASVIEEFPPAENEFAPIFQTRRTAPGYFEAMDVPLIEGRTFTPDDHNQRLPAVIISHSFKARYWPDESALGKRITIAGRIPTQVVGVVGDVRDASLDIAGEQFLYLPMVDSTGGGVRAMTMTVHTAVEPLGLVSAIRSAIAEVDSDLPMARVQSMDRVLGDSMSGTSFTMALLVIGALIAVFLGTVGIYGVLSYVVSLRTAEIGIRSALGASPDDLRRMVLSQGMRLAAVGVLIGLVAAVALGRVIRTLLYETSPVDAVTLVVASAIFMAVAVVASLVPATRAAGTAPVDALRGG